MKSAHLHSFFMGALAWLTLSAYPVWADSGRLSLPSGIPAPSLIAMFPSVNGYFFIPNYPTVVAAINFDQTGTTGIGRYVLNHSFMIPGMVATIGAVAMGLVFTRIFF